MERNKLWPAILAAVAPVLLRATVAALLTAALALGLLPADAARCLAVVPGVLPVPFGL